ncbi:MAG: sigma-70 family RNA polymerase sigma factor [Clostridia bacterium]|nr:sigma-70 family RNA polymerase sigma factor [Clostridia bacterium]
MVSLSFYLMAIDSEEARDKLTQIYTQYYSTMRAVAHRFLSKHNSTVEEDIVHDSIITIINNMHKIDMNDETALKCFVCTVVRHKAIDWIRHEYRAEYDDFEQTAYSVEDTDPLPLDAIVSREGYEIIIRCINELSDNYKDVCNLKFVCKMTEKDIASILGLTVNNVGVRIMRGRKKLMAKISEAYYGKQKTR